MLLVAVAWSFSDDTAIGYVLPVLWMTSCFLIMERIGRLGTKVTHIFVQFARWRNQSDVRQRCLVEIGTWRHRR